MAGNKGVEPSASRLARYSTPVAAPAPHYSPWRIVQELNLLTLAGVCLANRCVTVPPTTHRSAWRGSNPRVLLGRQAPVSVRPQAHGCQLMSQFVATCGETGPEPLTPALWCKARELNPLYVLGKDGCCRNTCNA